MCGSLSPRVAACLQYDCFTVEQALDWRGLFYYARGIVLGILPAPCVHPEAPGQT